MPFMLKNRLTRGALAAALATLYCPAFAQDLTNLPLEQLLTLDVYSASKFSQKASEAPSTVSVITAADIRAFGWRTLADVLRSMRGLYVNYDRSYSYLGARGFQRPGDYNSRFLLQIDGNRINDVVYDQAPLGGEFPLDLDLIERIEYVPGPGSSIYGANAFFGVINIITRRPQELEGSRASISGGQAGARQGSASYAWRDGEGHELLLAASRSKTDGADLAYAEFASPDNPRGIAHGLDYESGHRLYAKAVSGAWTLSAIHAERIKGMPAGSFDQIFDDPSSRTIDTQNYLDLAYRQALAAQTELSARLYWGSYDSLGDYPTDETVRVVNRDISTGRWWGAEAKLVTTLANGHKLLAGAEYQDDYSLRQLNFDLAPYTQYLDENHRAGVLGLYVQDEVPLSSQMLLNAGLRYDHRQQLGGVLNPRLALIDDLGGGTTLKAMYGSAYRAPNNYELYYYFTGPGGQLANPGLARERIRSTELALIQQWGQQRRLTLSLYQNNVSSLISQVTDDASGLPIFRNASSPSARGIEAEYEQNWSNGTRLRTSISWQHVSQDDGSVNSPAALAKLNLALPLHGAWNAGIEAQYVGPRDTIAGGHSGGFWLANLNLYSVHLSRHADLALAATNLFDRYYADPASSAFVQPALGQDGRRLRVKLDLAF